MSGRAKKGQALPPPPSPKASAAARNANWLPYLTVVLSCFLLLSAFSPEITDSDFWWHLKTGQYILQNHRLPSPDPFAYTTAGAGSAYPGEELVRQFNLTHEWLFQVVLYSVYAVGGFAGVVLVRAMTLTMLCGVVGFVAYRRSRGFYRSILAALLCASIATLYTSDRPFGFSFLLLAVTIALLDFRRYLFMLPVVFLIWSNLHGGFIVGWAALGAYAGEALVARWRGKPQTGDRTLWIVCAASIAASALNPNLFDALRVVTLYKQSVLQSRVWEWQQTRLLPITPFSLLFTATAATMLWANRKARVSDWLLYAAFAAASLAAVRNVMLIGILGPILIASYLPWKVRISSVTQWIAAGLLLAGIGWELAQGQAFRLTANVWKYPSGAAKFLEDHGVRGRLFNDYTDGGFLIWRLWPFQRVFIDGRALSDRLYEDFSTMATNGNSQRGTARDLIQHYGIDVVALSGFEYVSGTLYWIVPVMSDSSQSEWKLVYLDENTSVLMKSPPIGVAPIKLPYPLAGVEPQCRNHIAHEPSTPLCARTLAFQFVGMNDLVRAREWFGLYLDHKTGEDAQAEAAFRLVLRRR